MAYIYKRGDKWAYRAYAGKDPITKKDKQASKSGFRTKKDAQLAAAIFERQFHNGEFLEPSNVTFKEMSEQFLEHYLSQGAKISSHRARKKALAHIIDRIGTTPIQKITVKMYQDSIDALAKKYSYNYMASIHSSANMVFKYACDMKVIKESPIKGAKLPKQKKTVEELKEDNISEKFLEKKELEEFLLVAKNEGIEGDLLAFTLLSYTGMRVGEMLALKWSDIDFKNHTLRIYKTYYNESNNKKKYEILTPKTEGSIRTIEFNPVLDGLFEEHREFQERNKQDYEMLYHDDEFIFTTKDGYPQTIKQISLRLKRLLEKTSIKKNITPHSFRHTHTSLLIEANVHIKEIQERLGHSDINTTMGIYAHMTKNMKKKASTKFGKLMNSLSEKIKS
ncbi:MAG TPA: site-specific integrase [Firmicutes bacterium]|nr:site-specific integrase [Bacillota bacterium]